MKTTELAVNFNQIGVVSVNFGDKLKIEPDYTGHMQINYRCPRGSYLYKSIADVVTGNFDPERSKGKLFWLGHRQRESATSGPRPTAESIIPEWKYTPT